MSMTERSSCSYDVEHMQERDDAVHELKALRHTARAKVAVDLQAQNYELSGQIDKLQATVDALQQRCDMLQSTYGSQVARLESQRAFLAAERSKCLCRADCNTNSLVLNMLASSNKDAVQSHESGCKAGTRADARSMLGSAEAIGRARRQLLQRCFDALQSDTDAAAAAEKMMSGPKAIQILTMLTAQHHRCVPAHTFACVKALKRYNDCK